MSNFNCAAASDIVYVQWEELQNGHRLFFSGQYCCFYGDRILSNRGPAVDVNDWRGAAKCETNASQASWDVIWTFSPVRRIVGALAADFNS